jgi:hypothetical protein
MREGGKGSGGEEGGAPMISKSLRPANNSYCFQTARCSTGPLKPAEFLEYFRIAF